MIAADLRLWNDILVNAESNLRRAQREALQWRETIVLIRRKIRDQVPWPAASQTAPGEEASCYELKAVDEL